MTELDLALVMHHVSVTSLCLKYPLILTKGNSYFTFPSTVAPLFVFNNSTASFLRSYTWGETKIKT